MKQKAFPLLVLICLAIQANNPCTAAGLPPSKQQIESDFLRQAEVRTLSLKVNPEEDAAGGCDGLKNGKWGFHTALEDDPWWQVDLTKEIEVGSVVIFNRCDGTAGRANCIKILSSADGINFKMIYEHSGSTFYGYSDNKPLIVKLTPAKARFIRIQAPGRNCLNLDEIEIYTVDGMQNLALGKPATQSSVCEWSTRKSSQSSGKYYPIQTAIERGLRLATNIGSMGVKVDIEITKLQEISALHKSLSAETSEIGSKQMLLDVQWIIRSLTFKNPLLNFDSILFATSAPGRWSHMSDQYLGWWSRPGGSLQILDGFKSDNPKIRCLTSQLPAGNVLRPDISYDGKKALFAWCRYYPGLSEWPDKLDKSRLPEDSFYHVFEISLDGTGLRQLTHGKYNDFDARYLPDGQIVFCSTRRGQSTQYTVAAAESSLSNHALPEAYVRCGGGPDRPCAVYTLHTMDADGRNLKPISAFEMFEWTPSVSDDGRILYSRWDYVDRYGQNAMGLWSTLADGTGAQAIYGNFTRNPECVFEARSIPSSSKLVFTASGHHSITAGSLVLLDPSKGPDDPDALTRITPEVPFPESEGRPKTYYANPYPLSEEYYLTAWSDSPLKFQGEQNDIAALGLYIYDVFGNLTLLYRDQNIGSQYPLPVRPRRVPPQTSHLVQWEGPQEGLMLLLNVYQGLDSIPKGTIKRLRIIAMPLKTHPTMNSPVIGLTTHDSGRFVLGTVPVEEDGSAFFHVPSGMSLFFQALDAEGMAVQTMRSATYLQPGQSYTCIGCHEHRRSAPVNHRSLASKRTPSKLTPGPTGSWPLDYATLVQPVIQRECVQCHAPGTAGSRFDLSATQSYDSLVNYGSPSLKSIVVARYQEQRSIAGKCEARSNPMISLLKKGHYNTKLSGNDWDRLITWMDTLGQSVGHFSADQEQELQQLKQQLAAILERQ